MQAERVVDHVDLAVERHFVNRGRIAQEFVAQILDVVVQRTVIADIMGFRITLQQYFAKAALVHYLADLGKCLF